MNFESAMNIIAIIRANRDKYPDFKTFADKNKKHDRAILMRLWFYAITTEGEATEERVKVHFI